jgi:hypothetical protein
MVVGRGQWQENSLNFPMAGHSPTEALYRGTTSQLDEKFHCVRSSVMQRCRRLRVSKKRQGTTFSRAATRQQRVRALAPDGICNNLASCSQWPVIRALRSCDLKKARDTATRKI